MIRFLPFVFTLVAAVASAAAAAVWGSAWLWLFAITASLALIGCADLLQKRHTLWRNFPVVGHLRWLLEAIRPQVRQYFLEDELSGAPFNREQRALVYARAKGDSDFEPFGTELDVRRVGFKWINHAIAPAEPADPPSVSVGAATCALPYDTALLNISAMSFGALGANAVRALNRGAALGGFAQDTGEGGISSHHRQGGDLIWEIGSGYFGCRRRDGGFDPDAFAETAIDPQVKMIEIKLSQGAKAGHGGILPARKVSAEIAAARGVEPGEDCVSPSRHSAFSTPLELIEFAGRLRRLSGGKPVGIKLCIGHPWELLSICKAMLETAQRLDFIVVDGKEGGTGAAPEEFSDSVGTPLRDGLIFTRNALVGCGLHGDIRLGASGKIVSGFDIARALALGADWCNAARPFMFALGCVQSRRCHMGTCPTGVATQNRARQYGLVVTEKSRRVARYQASSLRALTDLVAAAGLESPAALRPDHLWRRVSVTEAATFADLYGFLEEGELTSGARDPWYAEQWALARADSFSPRRAERRD